MRGDRLRYIRELRGHSQESLAELLKMGVKQIWRYENNETKPSGDTIARIALLLDISTDYLLGVTDDPKRVLAESDLAPKERAAIDAWRRGEKYEAIKAIVGDE